MSSHIAVGIFHKFSRHPKLKSDTPRGCVLAVQDPSTRVIEYSGLGTFVSARNQKSLEKICDRAIEALEKAQVLPQTDIPLSVAGFKTKDRTRFALAGMDRDLGDLFLGVYLFRLTRLTREEVLRFWHQSENKYIVGDILLL